VDGGIIIRPLKKSARSSHDLENARKGIQTHHWSDFLSIVINCPCDPEIRFVRDMVHLGRAIRDFSNLDETIYSIVA
jgi:hypothetical protein